MERVSREPSSTARDMRLYFRVQSSVLKPLLLQWLTQTDLVTAISGEKEQSKDLLCCCFTVLLHGYTGRLENVLW